MSAYRGVSMGTIPWSAGYMTRAVFGLYLPAYKGYILQAYLITGRLQVCVL